MRQLAAAALSELGCQAQAWVLAPFESLSPDALNNLQAALKLDLPVEAVPGETEWAECLSDVARAEVVVDAILGTGLSEPARGLPQRVIEYLNALPAFKVSVDVPSGLSADSGRVPGVALKADATVALAAPKVCHFIPPACEHCGEVSVASIGIPPSFLDASDPRLETIESSEVGSLWPERKTASHKGDFGHLLVIAGSQGKSGAALMTATAALRVGAGLVSVAAPKSVIPMMAPAAPEVMWEGLPETDSGSLAKDALEPLQELIATRTGVAIGPGLSQHPETVEVVRELIPHLVERGISSVIDADALNAIGNLAGRKNSIPPNRCLGLTPHPGEAGRLLGAASANVQLDRVQTARELASRSRSHVLLKGFRSLIADPEGNLKVNLAGDSGMATAGAGDVLTGIIGGLCAQGVPVGDALSLGAHVHGLAGERAAAELGSDAVIATDLIEWLGEAIQSVKAASEVSKAET